MNKKGFTLIELLAVIVILAIIALIATPIILNIINEARKSSAKSAALGYIDAIEYNNGFAEVEQPGYTKVTSGTVASINVKLKGKKPDSGNVTIDTQGKVSSATLCFNNYNVTYNGKDVIKVEKGCSGNTETSENTSENTTRNLTINSDNYATNLTDTSHHYYGIREASDKFIGLWVWESSTPSDFFYKEKIKVNSNEVVKLKGKAAVWHNGQNNCRFIIGFSADNTNSINSFTESQTLSNTFNGDDAYRIDSSLIYSNLQDFEVTIDEPGEYYVKGISYQTSIQWSCDAALTEISIEKNKN